MAEIRSSAAKGSAADIAADDAGTRTSCGATSPVYWICSTSPLGNCTDRTWTCPSPASAGDTMAAAATAKPPARTDFKDTCIVASPVMTKTRWRSYRGGAAAATIRRVNFGLDQMTIPEGDRSVHARGEVGIMGSDQRGQSVVAHDGQQ